MAGSKKKKKKHSQRRRVLTLWPKVSSRRISRSLICARRFLPPTAHRPPLPSRLSLPLLPPPAPPPPGRCRHLIRLPCDRLTANEEVEGPLETGAGVQHSLFGRCRAAMSFSAAVGAPLRSTPSLTHSLTISSPNLLLHLLSQRGACNPSRGDTVGHTLSLYGEKTHEPWK